MASDILCRKCRGKLHCVEEMTEQGAILVIKCIICGERHKERPNETKQYRKFDIDEEIKRTRHKYTNQFFAANMTTCTKAGCTGTFHDVAHNKSRLCLECRNAQQKWDFRKRHGKAFGPSPLLKTEGGWIDNPEYESGKRAVNHG